MSAADRCSATHYTAARVALQRHFDVVWREKFLSASEFLVIVDDVDLLMLLVVVLP